MRFFRKKAVFLSCLAMVALMGVWWLLNTGASNRSEESVLIVTEKEKLDSVLRPVSSKKSLPVTDEAKIKMEEGDVAPIESLPLVSVPSEKRGDAAFFDGGGRLFVFCVVFILCTIKIKDYYQESQKVFLPRAVPLKEEDRLLDILPIRDETGIRDELIDTKATYCHVFLVGDVPEKSRALIDGYARNCLINKEIPMVIISLILKSWGDNKGQSYVRSNLTQHVTMYTERPFPVQVYTHVFKKIGSNDVKDGELFKRVYYLLTEMDRDGEGKTVFIEPKIEYAPQHYCVSNKGTYIASFNATGWEGTKLFLFTFDKQKLYRKNFKVAKKFDSIIEASCFSPCENYLVMFDARGCLQLFDVKSQKTKRLSWFVVGYMSFLYGHTEKGFFTKQWYRFNLNRVHCYSLSFKVIKNKQYLHAVFYSCLPLHNASGAIEYDYDVKSSYAYRMNIPWDKVLANYNATG